MKRIIHVNRNILASNKKNGLNAPPIIVREGRTRIYAHKVQIEGPSCFVHSEDEPLDCGARVWIETEAPITIVEDDYGD